MGNQFWGHEVCRPVKPITVVQLQDLLYVTHLDGIQKTLKLCERDCKQLLMRQWCQLLAWSRYHGVELRNHLADTCRGGLIVKVHTNT